MLNMKKKLIVMVLTSLLTITAGILLPTSTSKPMKTIEIGVIASYTGSHGWTSALFEEIIEPDINEYLEKLPNLPGPPLRIDFLIENAEGSAAVHLEKVQMFHEMEIDLIIGGLWSSQAAGSLDYINENDMLLLSSSSTAPPLAISGDNLFRLSPDDSVQGKIIARMMETKGITNAIVLYRNDDWGSGLFEIFEVEYAALGGTTLGALPYDGGETDFTSYLAQAEDLAEGKDNVGVLLISFDELRQIIIQASDGSYPNIYNPPWFGTESSGRSQATLDEAPDQAVHLKIYSALSVAPASPKFTDLNERYEELFPGYPAGYYHATMADAAWILAQAVLETQITETEEIRGPDIINVLPDIAWRHYGYSGYCLLNEAGDRASGLFDIWGYTDEPGYPAYKRYGSYDSVTDELTWFETFKHLESLRTDKSVL
jgi:branched-chain amino acid transport system substrate-binding protein